MKAVPITKEQLVELRKQYNNNEIASKYGVSVAWVEKKVQEFGLQNRPYWKSGKVAPPRSQIKEYLRNHTQSQTSKHFGVALKTLYKWLKEYQLEENEYKFDFVSKAEFERLTKKMSIPQIAAHFDVPIYRIEELIRRFEIKLVSHQPVKLDKDELSQTISECNFRVTCERLGVGERIVRNNIENYDFVYIRKKPSDESLYGEYPAELTELQRDRIIGHLLGDGYIPASCSRSHPFKLSQKEGYKEWLKQSWEILAPFSKPIYEISKIMKDKVFKGFRFNTITHPLFSKLREQWYESMEPHAAKILPDNLELTWSIIATWYADDGCNSNSRPCAFVYLCSQSFSKEENQHLRSMLRQLGIKSTLNNRPNNKFLIRIGKQSYLDFIEGVKPFLSDIKCMQHKLQTYEERMTIQEKS